MGETIRVQHSKDYTVISNSAIRDSRLSFKARGLHHLLLSYPDGWQINTDHLSGQSEKDGKTSVLSALKELEQLGYLTRKQIRIGGKITAYESIIRELPQPGKPQSENLNTVNLNPENLKSGKPQSENLNTVNLNPENLNAENLDSENLLHNKYLIQEVFKKEISKEEVSSGLSPAKEDLKEEDLRQQISGKQINPHGVQGTPAVPLKNVYAQAKNVWDLIDTFLLSPELADAPIPEELTLVYNEKFKWSGWVWPWRSKRIDGVFQNFNPAVVEKLAADLARKDGARVDQKYSHAINAITKWEKDKGGWQKILVWCDRPQSNQATTAETTEAEAIEIPEYFKTWSPEIHLMIYENEFRKCHSLQDFYKIRTDYKAWLVFAKQEHPDWNWSLGQKPKTVL
jgi:hypothetical protein